MAGELPPAHLRDPGDQWVYGPNGEKVWGAFGAAGVLVWNREADTVLLQLRAEWSHHGGTWGIPGGAIRLGESAVDGAFREADEEAGVPRDLLEAIDEHIIDLGFWSYTTVVARTREHFEPKYGDHESLDLKWIPRIEVEGCDLHPRFATSWPTLRDLLAKHLN